MIQFKVSTTEAKLISQIADRVLQSPNNRDNRLTIEMDLTACHANGCPLDLPRLLAASHADFWHDINGIRLHLDRGTGQIQDAIFHPRHALS